MSQILTLDFKRPDAKSRNLIERMARFDLQERVELLQNQFGQMVFRTRFALADQVLLHALVSSRTDARIIQAEKPASSDDNRASLIKISQEAYGIRFGDHETHVADLFLDTQIRIGRKTSFAGKDVRSGLLGVNPVADWQYNDLVQYVLDHEVPVNPMDMPGFTKRVA